MILRRQPRDLPKYAIRIHVGPKTLSYRYCYTKRELAKELRDLQLPCEVYVAQYHRPTRYKAIPHATLQKSL
jgi:hypothetical protein